MASLAVRQMRGSVLSARLIAAVKKIGRVE
jgi:hypothetical protein